MIERIRSHYLFSVLLGVLLLLGLFIYKDYGISWDEGSQRVENGLVNYNYVHHGNVEALLSGNEKYHGPAFELTLIYIEKFFDMKETRDIYLMRHLVTYFVYRVSILFFYLLVHRELKDKKLAFLATLILVLSPRIFADAF